MGFRDIRSAVDKCEDGLLGYVQTETMRLLTVSRGLEDDVERLSSDVSENFRRTGEKAVYESVTKIRKILREFEQAFRGEKLPRNSLDSNGNHLRGYDQLELNSRAIQSKLDQSPLQKGLKVFTEPSKDNIQVSGKTTLIGSIREQMKKENHQVFSKTANNSFFPQKGLSINPYLTSEPRQQRPQADIRVKELSTDERGSKSDSRSLHSDIMLKRNVRSAANDSPFLIEGTDESHNQNKYLNQMMEKIFGVGGDSHQKQQTEQFASIQSANRISKSLQRLQAANHMPTPVKNNNNWEGSLKSDAERSSSLKKIRVAVGEPVTHEHRIRFSATEMIGKLGQQLDSNKRLLDLISKRTETPLGWIRPGWEHRARIFPLSKNTQLLHFGKPYTHNMLAGGQSPPNTDVLVAARNQGTLRQAYDARRKNN